MTEKEKPTHYVNNKEFFEAILEHKKRCKECEAEGKPKPRIPDYIGECLLKIANKLSNRYNFVDYSYKDEMVSDALENCIAYFDNFDETKTKNPFAYFTQIIYWAFVRRIKRERTQVYLKHKLAQKKIMFNELAEHAEDQDEFSILADIETDYINDFVESYESSEREKKLKQKEKRDKIKEANFFNEDD
jgi:DNA-directed RNA polymerase specialized sigma24 family protein